MLASINLTSASSGHQTHNQILFKFPFPCQLASTSAAALNDKSMITGWFYNTLGWGITGRQSSSQRAHSLSLPCWRKWWISFIRGGPLLSWNSICTKLFGKEEPLGVFKWQARAHMYFFSLLSFVTSSWPHIFHSIFHKTKPPHLPSMQNSSDSDGTANTPPTSVLPIRCLLPQNGDHL